MTLRAQTVVLIVEDEALVRYAVAQELSAAGYEVVESSTAEDAIARLEAGPRIDVVFTDIQLAGRLTGWDVAEQFRAANSDLPIIYASGNVKGFGVRRRNRQEVEGASPSR